MHIIINGWFMGQTTAGSGQYLAHLLTPIAQQAPESQITLLVPKGAAQLLTQSVALLDPVDVVEERLPKLPKNLAKLWWEQVTIPLAAKRLRADVLWVPYWAAPLWQPCPTVVTVHDLIPALLPAYQGGRMQRLYTSLVSHTARRAKAVITVSDSSARDIVDHLHIPHEQVYAVHNGLNQAEFNGAENGAETDRPDPSTLAAIRQKYALPERFFLYLGGFDVRKNLRATLEAYRLYLDRGGDPAVRLVIAGKRPQTDSAFAPDPQKIATELNLIDQVQFCGWVPDADKSAIYALATAYIFPSLYEGFGMMVLEAMGAGTAVVTSGPAEGALVDR